MPESLEHLGCKLSYTVRGNGPPVLFIQGVGVHGDGWKPQIDALSEHFQCMSFDNRGIGLSQPANVPITVEQMADDARALADAQGWSSMHVVGHSLGGLVALQFALTHRDRVHGLSLLCTFAAGRDAAKLTPWMFWVGMRTRIGTRRMRRNAFLQIVMPKHVLAHADRDKLAEELAPLFGHDLADQPPIVGKQLKAMRACDLTSRLGELSGMPTLVVSATHDRIASLAAGKKIAAGIPGARFVEVEDASHGLPIQCADKVNGLLIEHSQSKRDAMRKPNRYAR